MLWPAEENVVSVPVEFPMWGGVVSAGGALGVWVTIESDAASPPIARVGAADWIIVCCRMLSLKRFRRVSRT